MTNQTTRTGRRPLLECMARRRSLHRIPEIFLPLCVGIRLPVLSLQENHRGLLPAEEMNIFSRTMEMHQRNESANAKIMAYLGRTYLYPTSFDALLYASQLLQADAIRYGVEHWRRNRGRCMGAIYCS